MRFLPLLLLLPTVAVAQDAPPRSVEGGGPPQALSAGLPPPPPAPRAIIGRLFISPSGEPFRAPMDAPYPLATWFAGADHNHDGKVDLTELTWDFDRFFDTLDVDHDGTLRNDEIERYERMVPELHSGFASSGGFRGAGGGHGGGGGAGGYHGDAADTLQDEGQSGDNSGSQSSYVPLGNASRYELISIPEPVSSMDTDLSGTVTRLELHRAAARRFAILDQKQRGYIMLADLPEPDAERHPNPPRNRR